MEKYGIDWTKIAIEVNNRRQAAITLGTLSSRAFNVAYQEITRLYPSITGEAWKEGRKIVGQIMAEWKAKKKRSARSNKERRSAQKITGKSAATKNAARIVKVEESKNHLTLVLEGMYEAVFTPTDKGGISASVRRLDRSPCKQKEVAAPLIKDARAIAEKHFHGDKSTAELY